MQLTPNQIITNPEHFAKVFLKVLDKNKNLIPFIYNKAQRDFQSKRTGRDLILKARQLGFSTLVQGEIFRRVVTGTRTTMTLAHDDDTTQKLRTMADRFYEHCKFGEIQPLRKYANATLTTYPEFDSAVYIATAGNKQSGRGGTYTDLHGSEVAFWKDAESIIAGAMQGGNPDVVLESTPNGAQGYFYEKCMEALSGRSIWTLHFYSWWWDDTYRLDGEPITLTDEEKELKRKHNLDDSQIRWRRLKQQELGRYFIQEYPEDMFSCFLTSGNSYFGDLSNAFVAPMDVVYNPEHEYVAGLDFGQTNDYTAMVVIDKTTKQQVDLLHIRKLEWSEQRKRIVDMYKKWSCARMVAERNSIGGVNIEELLKDKVSVISFTTTNASKSEIMSNLYEGIHTRGLKLQGHSIQRHEMSTFVSTQTPTGAWRLAAEGDGHDDTVIALALAYSAMTNAVQIVNNPFRD